MHVTTHVTVGRAEDTRDRGTNSYFNFDLRQRVFPPDSIGLPSFMSPPHSSPAAESPVLQKRARQVPRRQPLSCLPCRQHKLRCDRHVPCGTCSRYRRQGLCLQHPAPAKGRQRDLTQNALSTNLGSAGGGGREQRRTQATDRLNPSHGHPVDNFHMASAARAV